MMLEVVEIYGEQAQGQKMQLFRLFFLRKSHLEAARVWGGCARICIRMSTAEMFILFS